MKSRYLPMAFDRFMDPSSLFDGMHSLAEYMGAPFFEGGLSGLSARVDLYRKDGKLFVEAELPGIKPDGVELHVYPDRLTLSAEKLSETKEGGEDKSYFHSERRWGKVERVISFPVEADPESARASFKDGVLTIEAAEKSQDKAHKKVAITAA